MDKEFTSFTQENILGMRSLSKEYKLIYGAVRIHRPFCVSQNLHRIISTRLLTVLTIRCIT